MKKTLITTAVAGALFLPLAGCASSADMPPKPSYASVPTTSPTPVAGIDTPLASTIDRQIGYAIQVSVYDVEAWEAVGGCDCSAPGDEGTELFPSGSTAWAVRVDLETRADHFGEGVEMGGVELTSTWGPGAPVPVVVDEAKALAKELDLGWGFDSVKSPSLFPWSQKRSFLLAVYVPRGAVDLRLEMVQPPIPSDHNPSTVTYGLDVPLPQSVIDLMYANSNGD